jgi:hypothetical protein
MNKAFITLASVIIVSAIGLAIVVSFILLGISSLRTSFAIEQSNQARMLANTCAEQALEQIKSFPSFEGTAGLTLGQGNCTYTIANLGEENRSITASGSVGAIIRKVKITISDIVPQIIVVSWQEVGDF